MFVCVCVCVCVRACVRVCGVCVCVYALTHDNSRENMFFTDIPQLSEGSKSSCEGKITKKECLESLKGVFSSGVEGASG